MNKNYYEIIETTKAAVERDILNNKKRTLKEQDKFVRDKYERTMKLLKIRMKVNTSPDRLQELRRQEKEVKFAYEQLKSPILRDLYNQKLIEIEEGKREKIRNMRIPRKRTAYDILNTTRDALELRTEEENDLLLKEKRNQLLDKYLKMLMPNISFSDKNKIELAIAEIKEKYELIKTADRRKEYNKQLDKQKQEEMRKIKQQEIKDKYSHALEYDVGLIDSSKNKRTKMVLKEKIKDSNIFFLQNNRNTQLRRKGEVYFRNCTGTSYSYINEYEVVREIGGEQKRDIIYTNLLLSELGIDKDTGKPVNPQYYECVVNKLLAEDTIEGSKYNGGYIGMIEKTEDGDYDITLDKGELNQTEQEYLTAVMIMKKREEKSKEVKREGEGK